MVVLHVAKMCFDPFPATVSAMRARFWDFCYDRVNYPDHSFVCVGVFSHPTSSGLHFTPFGIVMDASGGVIQEEGRLWHTRIYTCYTFSSAAVTSLFLRKDLPSRVAAGLPACLSLLVSGSLSSLASTVNVTL